MTGIFTPAPHHPVLKNGAGSLKRSHARLHVRSDPRACEGLAWILKRVAFPLPALIQSNSTFIWLNMNGNERTTKAGLLFPLNRG